jgi:lipopolysaccharide transport system ATP-binding protein
MTDTAISVQGLGKNYIIGHKKEGDFRHAIGNKLRNIFKPDASEKEVFWALKDINFEIKHGEAVGIIGRNGAGKSTLLKILSRITDPSAGRFEINGRVSSLLEVGTGFHAELSGRENIYLNGTILGMKRSEIKQKFDEIVEFSGVEKFLDTPVKHYSSGMKVRLAFSVAAHLEPEILIVDEVLAVGDAEFQKKCLGKMDQVSKNEGRTVIFVSHNMGAVESLCKSGILLTNGIINFTGDISQTISKYIANISGNKLDTHWKKEKLNEKISLEIVEVKITLLGKQPNHKLRIETMLHSNETHVPAFIAFDLMTEENMPLFQSIPTERPFIQFSNNQIITSIIELPSLIPGSYNLSVWVGPNYFDTFSWEQQIVSFTIESSPMIGRTHPHSKRNGFFNPYSEIVST